MKYSDADARLAGDGSEVVRHTVGVHEVGEKLAHVAAQKASRHDVVAQLPENARDV